MRILILSDLHLDKPRGELKKFDIEDAEVAIQSLGEYTEGIDAVVIAGDIFNATRVDSIPLHLLNMLGTQIKDIPQKYTIRGNHDRARFSILEDMLGYTALKPYENIDIGDGITISGCDFTDIDTHREYLSKATSDILLCHFPMSPFSTFSDLNISVNDCPEDRVVIVGDTHKPDVYAENNRCVISPGCLFPADKTEILSGHAGTGFILDICKPSGNMSLQLRPIWLKSRFGVDLSSIKTKDELLLGLKSIELTGRFLTNLKPVVYVDPALADLDIPESTNDSIPEFEFIPVSKSTDDTGNLTADFGGLTGEDIDTRIRRILATLYKESSDADKLVEMTVDLITTDDPTAVLESYIRC